jgi:hypothetical protein
MSFFLFFLLVQLRQKVDGEFSRTLDNNLLAETPFQTG